MMEHLLPVPEYEPCYIAFLDILGFKEKVMESKHNEQLMAFLYSAMKICASFPAGSKKVSTEDGGVRELRIQSRFFSDSIVFFIKENEEDFAQLLFILRFIQDQLWERGICLRGSVTVGEMYWPENEPNVTLGPGLIDAYEMERDIAIYPRIIMSNKLYCLSMDLPANPFGAEGSSIKDYVRRDADGVYYLDLLSEGITRKEGERLQASDDHFYIEWNPDNSSSIGDIRFFVTKTACEALMQSDVSARVVQKYEWLRTYLSVSEGRVI